MRIVTPTEIEDVAWEGGLEPLGDAFRGPESPPRITLGRPAWWPAETAMEAETGKKWAPPADGRDYTLVRLACTLHPSDSHHTRYAQATLRAYLRPAHGPGAAVAHDLYPRRLGVEEKGTFKLGLGPELKFAGLAEIKLFEIGAEIEFRQVFPAVQAFGLGEASPYWEFRRHEAHPLAGCQSVYAVLAAPAGAGGVRLSLELVAEYDTRWGLRRAGLPPDAHAHLSHLVGR